MSQYTVMSGDEEDDDEFFKDETDDDVDSNIKSIVSNPAPLGERKLFRPELSHITEESSCKSPPKATTLDHSLFQPDKRALNVANLTQSDGEEEEPNSSRTRSSNSSKREFSYSHDSHNYTKQIIENCSFKTGVSALNMIQENEKNRVDALRLPSGISFSNTSHMEKTWEREARLNQEQPQENVEQEPISDKQTNNRTLNDSLHEDAPASKSLLIKSMAQKIAETASGKIASTNGGNISASSANKFPSTKIDKMAPEKSALENNAFGAFNKTAINSSEKNVFLSSESSTTSKKNPLETISSRKNTLETSTSLRKNLASHLEKLQLEESMIENQELCTSMHQLLNNFKRDTNANTPPAIATTQKSNFLMESSSQLPRTPLSRTIPQHTSRIINSSAIPSSVMNSPGYLPATRSTNASAPMIDVDKPLMYFGFRPLGTDSSDLIIVNSLVDGEIFLKFNILPQKCSEFKIVHKPDVKQARISRSDRKYPIQIVFRPKEVGKYKAQLQIVCTKNREQAEYSFTLLGFGGQACIVPFFSTNSGLKSLVLSSSGFYHLLPISINRFIFPLKNRGNRKAFVSIILQDLSGQEISVENAYVFPENFLLDRGQERKVEVRMFVEKGHDLSHRNSSTLLSRIHTGMSSQSGYERQAVAYRIIVLWGEEKQRERIKFLEKQKKEKFFIMNRYFSVMRFEGEESLPAEDDHLFSNQDYRMFSSYIRATIIEVRHPVTNYACSTRPSSATGNTVIELEPDNTFKVGCDN